MNKTVSVNTKCYIMEHSFTAVELNFLVIQENIQLILVMLTLMILESTNVKKMFGHDVHTLLGEKPI